jgi:hypothetical protein
MLLRVLGSGEGTDGGTFHKHCFSVRERGRVVAHTDQVTLRKARFVVQRSGYERTVREKVKCVHAWVRGVMTEMPNAASCAQVCVSGSFSGQGYGREGGLL